MERNLGDGIIIWLRISQWPVVRGCELLWHMLPFMMDRLHSKACHHAAKGVESFLPPVGHRCVGKCETAQRRVAYGIVRLHASKACSFRKCCSSSCLSMPPCADCQGGRKLYMCWGSCPYCDTGWGKRPRGWTWCEWTTLVLFTYKYIFTYG